MAQPQNNVSIVAPGFAGLNTQDSPLGMDISFASVADNCVIDNFGRIASRRGFNYLTTNPSILNGNPIVTLTEFVTSTNARYLFACGNNTIYLQGTSGSRDLVPLVLPVGYVINGDNWRIVGFNDKCYFVQANHKPLVFDPLDVDGLGRNATELYEWQEYPPFTAGSDWPNEAHAAFGRLWVADFDNDKTEVAWSGLLDGENWSTQGHGGLQTEEYWPSGYDRIRALAAHNDFMVVFGERNILVYSTTADVVSTLKLEDTIEGIGCVARDSVVPTGVDFMFIDATGVRSLNRTIQEKSLPIGDISRNVRLEFQRALAIEPQDDIKAVFHTEDSFYCCFLPGNPLTYVFDTWELLPDGSARATTWSNIRPRCGFRTLDRITYFGGVGGVYKYEGAQDLFLDGSDDTTVTFQSIKMVYFTHPIDFGAPANLVFPKQVDVTVFGGLTGNLNLSWGYDYESPNNRLEKTLGSQAAPSRWGAKTAISGFAEWSDPDRDTSDPGPGVGPPDENVGVIGRWSSGENLQQIRYNIWGSGRNIKIGFDADVLGSIISIQQVDIQALQGRIL